MLEYLRTDLGPDCCCQITVLLLTCCGTFGKLFDLADPQFLNLKSGVNRLSHKVVARIARDYPRMLGKAR